MAPLDIPISDAIARVQMIDTTGSIVVNAESFIEPSQRGHDFSSIPLNLPVAAFLIEHATSGKKVLFDLGTRVDYWNLPAIWQKLIINYAPGLRVDKDIKEILQEKGTALGDICEFHFRSLRCLSTPLNWFCVIPSLTSYIHYSERCLVTLPLGPHWRHGIISNGN